MSWEPIWSCSDIRASWEATSKFWGESRVVQIAGVNLRHHRVVGACIPMLGEGRVVGTHLVVLRYQSALGGDFEILGEGHVMGTALVVARQQGVVGTALVVAREKGVAAAVYHYFKTKEDIIEAIWGKSARPTKAMIIGSTESDDAQSLILSLIDATVSTMVSPDSVDANRLAMFLWAESLVNQRIMTATCRPSDRILTIWRIGHQGTSSG